MATRDRAPIGHPCWVDHLTNDADATRRFYTGIFGWEAGEASEEFGGYFQFFRDGVPVAGAAPAMAEHPMPDVWSVYLAVEDAQVTLDRAAGAGGTVIVPAMRVGDLGTMGMVTDPSGAAVGLWAPITFQGFGVLDEANAPKWFELHTLDYERAVSFYQDVFAWDTSVAGDTPEFRYTTADADGGHFAGMMDSKNFLPEGTPSHWTVYFGVHDVDAACARAVELGGSITVAAQDTPYGRLAGVADPGGAVFSVMQA
ncbi:MAG: VOC family protein [Acidimicrobiales bacterium]